MAGSFTYDVFLSHNSKDKPQVRKLAERLRQAGLRVWFDDWVIKPGDDIYLAIERGLEAARVQVLCLSPAALGSDWVALERSTVLFRDPSNAGRRFVPLLLADCALPDALRRYKYVDFRQETPEAFDELLAACRDEAEAAMPKLNLEKPPEKNAEDLGVLEQRSTGDEGRVDDVAVCPDGKWAASGPVGLNLTIGDKISSARKKIDDYLKRHRIETAITPAVSLFGLVEFSLGEVKIDTDTSSWTRSDERMIEEFVRRTAEISIQEFKELLKFEVEGRDRSEVSREVEEIVEYLRQIRDYPFSSPEEFESRPENLFLLKYKHFIGRSDEMEELLTFLNGPEEIGFMVGRGGVGKTKLALEFGKQVKAAGEWEVYFINRVADFIPIFLEDKTLLILDEAWGYSHREKVIDFVLRRYDGHDTKLLMIDRPISEESIISDLKEKHSVHIDPIRLEKGDIAQFLRENFEEFTEGEVQAIEEKSAGSFVYASFIAEHLREEGEVEELKNVLDHRVLKYLKDLGDRIGEEDTVRIRNAIFQLSLIVPIDWDGRDRDYIEEVIKYKTRYELLDRILDAAERLPTEFLICSPNNPRGFLIKPDPIADYLKAEFIKEGGHKLWIERIIPYMPLRLSLNVITTPESNDLSREYLFEIMGDIWRQLNSSGGKTPEYLSSLVLFTGNFRDMPFFNPDYYNIDIWMKCYRDIVQMHPYDPEVRKQLAMGLFNASNDYGKDGTADGLGKMEGCLEELRQLYAAHTDDPEVLKRLAMGLVNAAALSSEIVDFTDLTLLYKLRFDLPNDENKQKNIKFIEDKISEMIKNMLETEFEDDDSDLGAFIDKIKSELDDAEIILLKASEDLPLKIQRLILQSLYSQD